MIETVYRTLFPSSALPCQHTRTAHLCCSGDALVCACSSNSFQLCLRFHLSKLAFAFPYSFSLAATQCCSSLFKYLHLPSLITICPYSFVLAVSHSPFICRCLLHIPDRLHFPRTSHSKASANIRFTHLHDREQVESWCVLYLFQSVIYVLCRFKV
ncbi:hypothetical protein P692DRAFT_20297390 [Suillus brevipes Sb2]|nr:hypothetical protein P692DRAFT_20297390 [Suillus brevipes Sb2]